MISSMKPSVPGFAQMALNDVLYLALLEQCEERGVSRLERMRNTIAKRRL